MATAVDRRLPAIYDALDSGNNKAAVKLINTALQKNTKHQMLRVLKAVALQRSGKLDEGLQVCEEVRQEVPTDEQTLTTMTIVYRKANQMQAVSKAYAAASAARPKDGSLLRGVFANHVRSCDFAGQQQQAMKLHKLAGSNDEHYLWWAIVSMVLQAKGCAEGAPSALPADKLLQLAEGLISKQIQRSSLQSYEQLMLYTHVLQVEGKHQAALEAVQGKLGELVTLAAEKRSLEASLHLKDHLVQVTLGQLEKAAALYQEALQTNPDDWTSLQLYLDCMMPSTACLESPVGKWYAQDKPEASGQIPNQQAALAQAQKTVQALLQGLHSNPQTKADAAKGIIRGPQLAVVELQLRKLKVAQGRDSCQGLADAIVSYYQQLGHMLSCAADLRAYTRAVSGASKHWLSEQLQKELLRLQHLTSTPSEALLDLRRQITAYQIQFELRLPHETSAAAEAHVIKLLKLYQHSLTLCKGLDPKEKAPGDDLIPLAASTLMAAGSLDVAEAKASAEGSKTAAELQRIMQRRVLQALLVCEAAQKRSTVFAATRFACLALCGLLGAAGPAAANFDALAIKFIQHDTITGHHMLPVALGCLDVATAERLLDDSIALHDDHQRDAGDTLMMAYDRGTYTKVLEFVDFKRRLEQSHSLAVAQTEQALLALRRAVPQGYSSIHTALQGFSQTDAQIQPQAARPAAMPSLAQLRFNEDLSTRPTWLPPQGASPAAQGLSWWEQQPKQNQTEDTQHWWGCSGVVESQSSEAQLFRQASCCSLQTRWLMPQLAAQLFAGDAKSMHSIISTENGSKDDSKSDQMASLTQLSQLLGCPFTSLDDWLAQVTPSVVSAKQQQLDPLPHFSPQQHLEQKSREAHESRPDQLDSNSQQNSELSCQVNTGTQLPSGSVLQHGQASNPPQHMGGGAQPCDASSLLSEGSSQLRQHQLVSLAAFAAAAAGQDHWHEACSGSDAGPHACQSSFNIFIGCLGALQHLFSGICVTVAAQLSAHPDSVLSGSALLAAAHLVSEPATWVCLFMTSWQHVYAKKKTGIKSKDSMGHQLDSSQKIVRQHLERLVQAYIAGLQLVLAAVNTCLKVSTKALVADATQMALGSSENEQSGLAQTITECLPQADVQACLTVIVENEKLLLKRIKLQLSEQLSAV